MKYQVILTEGEDGWIVAECPSLPGCISQGRTRDEAIANIREAMEGWLEVEADKHSGTVPLQRESEFVEIEVDIPA